jgi:hypothetical protein
MFPTPTKHVLLAHHFKRTNAIQKNSRRKETANKFWKQPCMLVSEFEVQLFIYTLTTPTCLAHFLFTLPFGAMLGPSCVVACAWNTTLEIVRVCGRYRVGKPLGSGTFGMFILRSCHTRYSDPYRECLLRKRHQDWARHSFETRGYSRLKFKSCTQIQCLSGSFRTLWDPQGVLV